MFKILILFVAFQNNIQSLTALVDSLTTVYDFNAGTVAVSIRNVKTNQLAFEKNGGKSVNSASTLKLVSTGIALQTLGKDFKYSTFFEYDGQINDTILNGNLFIKGTGDPSFMSTRFEQKNAFERFGEALRKLGIKRVAGNVYGDNSYFQQNTPDSWSWGDMGNYYGASHAGLNFNENEYAVNFNVNKSFGEKPEILNLNPSLQYLEFKNDLFVDHENVGDNSIFYSNPTSNQVMMKGSLGSQKNIRKVKGSIPDPAFATAYTFKNYIKEKFNIEISGSALATEGYSYQTRNQILENQSVSIEQMIKPTNFESLNIYADGLLKTAAYQVNRSTTYEGAATFAQNYAGYDGIDLSGVNLKDGSGLSATGLVTTNFLTEFLAKMDLKPNFDIFFNSIPKVGLEGTVKNIGKNSKLVNNMRAKSGSIEGTRAYAGYFYKNNELFSFACIINRYKKDSDKLARQALEKIMINMVENEKY